MGAPHLYSCQFRAMINDWREKFHHASHMQTSDQFPFGFVQASIIELSALFTIFVTPADQRPVPVRVNILGE